MEGTREVNSLHNYSDATVQRTKVVESTVLDPQQLPSVQLSKFCAGFSDLCLDKDKRQEKKLDEMMSGFENFGITKQPKPHNITKQPYKMQRDKKYSKRNTPYAVSCIPKNESIDPSYLPLKKALEEWERLSHDKVKIGKLARDIWSFNVKFSTSEKFIVPSYVDLKSLPDLQKCQFKCINLKNNQLRHSFFYRFPLELISLNLSYNGLRHSSDIVEILYKHRNLKILELQGNELTNIPTTTFEFDHLLQELDLSSNHIVFTDERAENLLCYSHLSSLTLNNNALGYIPWCSQSLRKLCVRRMELKDDSVFILQELHLLEHLDLAENLLTTIPKITSVYIKYLCLHKNKLQNESNDFSLEKFCCLDTLDLSQNMLTKIPLINNHVVFLDVSENQIVSNTSILRLEGFINLRCLNLSKNHLTDFPFHFPEKLISMNLDGNNIMKYDGAKQIVSECLKWISITNNPIFQTVSILKPFFPSHVIWL